MAKRITILFVFIGMFALTLATSIHGQANFYRLPPGQGGVGAGLDANEWWTKVDLCYLRGLSPNITCYGAAGIGFPNKDLSVPPFEMALSKAPRLGGGVSLYELPPRKGLGYWMAASTVFTAFSGQEYTTTSLSMTSRSRNALIGGGLVGRMSSDPRFVLYPLVGINYHVYDSTMEFEGNPFLEQHDRTDEWLYGIGLAVEIPDRGWFFKGVILIPTDGSDLDFVLSSFFQTTRANTQPASPPP